MENECENLIKIMKESFKQVYEYDKNIPVFSFDLAKRIEIEKLKTMYIANYLKSVEVYNSICK